MSNYGDDNITSISAGQDLAFTKAMIPVEGVFVNQWTKDDFIVIRQLVDKKTHTNILFKIQQ